MVCIILVFYSADLERKKKEKKEKDFAHNQTTEYHFAVFSSLQYIIIFGYMMISMQ